MAEFEEPGGGGDFDGAFRERAAPKIPPRRRRGVDKEEEQGDGPEPAVKKTGVWGDETEGAGPPKVPMGRRRDGGGETASQAVDVPAASQFDDDDDIPVIPDLEENDEDDITLAVAQPGSIANAMLPTNLNTGSLPPSQVDGIDLSILYECIMPMKQLKDPAFGLKWKNVGMAKPTHGREIGNDKLKKMLARKTEFQATEWEDFGIDLRPDDFVKAGDSYFKPVDRWRIEDGNSMDPDVLLEMLKQEIQAEADRKESEATVDGMEDVKN